MAARGTLLKYLRVNVKPIQNPNPLFFNALVRRFSEEVRGTFLDKSEVADRVINVVKKFEKLDPSKVRPNAHFHKDLGLDSLDTVEVVMALEEEFGFEIPDNEADKISSINLAVDFIASHPQSIMRSIITCDEYVCVFMLFVNVEAAGTKSFEVLSWDTWKLNKNYYVDWSSLSGESHGCLEKFLFVAMELKDRKRTQGEAGNKE
ncbi:hypothetical protein ACFE04_028533 [Oxalis oulophora]